MIARVGVVDGEANEGNAGYLYLLVDKEGKVILSQESIDTIVKQILLILATKEAWKEIGK